MEELFDLVRIDDNGVEFEMLRRVDHGTAERLASYMETKAQQVYEVRRTKERKR